MIDGLKLIVPGSKVQELWHKKATYHRGRKAYYEGEVEKLKSVGYTPQPEKMSGAFRDPLTENQEGVERHEKKATECEFMAEYVDVSEQYLLGTHDLERLGVLSSRY